MNSEARKRGWETRRQKYGSTGHARGAYGHGGDHIASMQALLKRIRTVEYDPGYGWIARDPNTGDEVLPDFRWSSRSVARTVVAEARLLADRAALATEGKE